MFENLIIQTSLWVRPYLSMVALMVVATLLVLYGNNVNAAVRRQIQHYHFIVRTLIFILLCAFGYGLLTTLLAPFLATQLASVSNYYLGPLVVIITIALGVLAERKRQL
jgi:cell division protein FtsW (lipid II flippase)